MVYRIGLLGASNIAPTAVIEPARHIADVQVSAVAARDVGKATPYAKEHRIPTIFEDYDTLITSPDIDIVYIGLPPSRHAEWSIKALEAGKHVLCEKPIGMNVSEAKAMVAAAGRSEGHLVEAFHTAYHSGFLACQKWIADGKIGAIKSMTSHFGVPLEDDGLRNQFRPEAGGGSMMDMGCYPLQWVNTFARSSVSSIDAKAELTSSGVDGRMSSTLTFENGITADIACSMIGPGGFSAGLTIIGETGTIEFNDPLIPYDNGTLVLTKDDGQTEQHVLSQITTYQYQLEALVSALSNNTPLPTEGDAIIRQQELIDRTYEAAGIGHLRAI